MQHFAVWQNAWKPGTEYDRPLDIPLPDNWDVEFHSMPGDAQPPLSRKELEERIDAPINAPRIEALARGGREAVIVFDDLSRGTPVQELAELVLEALER